MEYLNKSSKKFWIVKKIEWVITCMRPFDVLEEQDQIVQVD